MTVIKSCTLTVLLLIFLPFCAVCQETNYEGVCVDVKDCDPVTGRVLGEGELVGPVDCCGYLGGKSLLLLTSDCKNCPTPEPPTTELPTTELPTTELPTTELPPTTAAPTSPSDVEGVYSEWTSWFDCSSTCGPRGTKKRHRLCMPDGAVCRGVPLEVMDCNRDVGCPGLSVYCPTIVCSLRRLPTLSEWSVLLYSGDTVVLIDGVVDGAWSRWSRWNDCSETCKHSRSRQCNNPEPMHGGQDCLGEEHQTTVCEKDPPCPVHGGWGEWQTLFACSRTCGGGAQTLRRKCDKPAPMFDGRQCVGASVDLVSCGEECCPVNGEWSEYSNWTPCEVTCDGGRRFRERKCDNPPPSCGGDSCSGFAEDQETCSHDKCPVDGKWGDWTPSSGCTHSCNRGSQQRFRKCDNPSPQNGGTPCSGFSLEFTECNAFPCPIHGKWSEWGSWSECPTTCGLGSYKVRNRKCDNPLPQHNGNPCPGPDTDTSLCHLVPCPVHGNWSEWTDWSECPKTCGGALHFRTRLCDNPRPDHGGRDCAGNHRQFQQCKTQLCPVHGAWSPWTEWSHCSTTCDRGGRNRSRECNNPRPKYGGDECPGMASEWQPCTSNCPVDGGWSQWSKFSPCTRSCEGGTKESFRECNSPRPRYDGRFCPGHARRTCECNKQPCPVDGKWSGWAGWSQCSDSCGGGNQERTRECNSPAPRYNGVCCQGPNKETKTCNSVNCPVNGNWGSWVTWTPCSHSCEGGRRSRTRVCNDPAPDFGGMQCADPTTAREEEDCKIQKCPVHGGWSDWTEFTRCDASCEEGTQRRVRQCSNPVPRYDGNDCPGHPTESRACNKHSCPVDGNYNNWEPWGQCSRQCGNGERERTRHCTPHLHGGRPCSALGSPVQSEPCCDGACSAVRAQTVTTTVSSTQPFTSKYYTSCGFAGWNRCTRYRQRYQQRYATAYYTAYQNVVSEVCN